MSIKWRSVKEVGTPSDQNGEYLVTDGIDISVSGISGRTHFKGDTKPTFTFIEWTGDANTGEDNSCCSGERYFDITPTHWCPIEELNLP